MGDRHADDHVGEGCFHEPDETDLISLGFRDSHGHDVGRGADHRAVAAEAGAERQRPPQGVFRARYFGAEKGDDREHGGGKRNVVHKRRHDGRHPQDQGHRDVEVAAGKVQDPVGDQGQQAGRFDSPDDNEKKDEEHQGGPFDVLFDQLQQLHFFGHQRDGEKTEAPSSAAMLTSMCQ